MVDEIWAHMKEMLEVGTFAAVKAHDVTQSC